ncbi:hypothetical protein HZ993_09290 [Rhodoferax sp. AJA081-3]|uniref:hypothetical protein n=1 Tax=Rhodoferax sp. AJA081-3 TaxID=2752316 RepID=UPI001AE08110|nr:hypothetical protein [Rhodoferax sp. AJA081-3]QTN29974.1 hypothetical protein HZ993_09290 [Rhodoferax sp. AJA081-3]
MPLLTFFVLTIAAIALIKLGALAVWAGLLAFALKVSIAVALLIAGWLGWKHYKSAR